MNLLKCDVLVTGPGPSEKIVGIITTEGSEEVVLHSSALDTQNRIEVGLLGFDNDRALVELPRESASGRWRVWVPAASVVQA